MRQTFRYAVAGAAWATVIGFACPLVSRFDRATAQRLLDKELADVTSAAHASDEKKNYVARKWHAVPGLEVDPTQYLRRPIEITGVADGPGMGAAALLSVGAEKQATFVVSLAPIDKKIHQLGGVAFFKKYDDGWRVEAILLQDFLK